MWAWRSNKTVTRQEEKEYISESGYEEDTSYIEPHETNNDSKMNLDNEVKNALMR